MDIKSSITCTVRQDFSYQFYLIFSAAAQQAGSCHISTARGEDFAFHHSAETNYTVKDCYHISHQFLLLQTATLQFFHSFPKDYVSQISDHLWLLISCSKTAGTLVSRIPDSTDTRYKPQNHNYQEMPSHICYNPGIHPQMKFLILHIFNMSYRVKAFMLKNTFPKKFLIPLFLRKLLSTILQRNILCSSFSSVLCI